MNTLELAFNRLEITFWNIAIALMSDARALQDWIEKTFPDIYSWQWIRFFAQAVILVGVGLTLGFVAGYLRIPR